MALLRPDNSEDLAEEDGDISSDNVPSPPTTYYCGCGPWKPQWLQRIVSPKLFTALLCTYSLIEGTVVSGECIDGSPGVCMRDTCGIFRI